MAFCRECGKEINDKAVVCPGCGCETNVLKETVFCRECGRSINERAVICPYCGCETHIDKFSKDGKIKKETGIIGWFVLSFCLPVVGFVIGGLLWSIILCLIGIILGLIWKENKPYTSKACFKGSISGLIVSIVCFFIFLGLFGRYFSLLDKIFY
jgi:RNA polymerase subunit RPABC4/transcription elongation factor Spt4